MKRQTINFSWPATLSFSTDNGNENERFSRGKLKVFYKGETADHRYFSDEFANELIKSLPYTPIVSHYDEEKDDFVGHATEQNIYGIVDPRGSFTFEERDGETWCVCDTVMYTERPDKVGEIAKKIEGHSQSLELDPNTVKYTINYDAKRHFKNIEFTAGHFVGVSVLGTDQKPAFTGSAFFSSDEMFEEKMKLLKDYCEQNDDQTQSGGNAMNLQEFMTLSWGDKSQKVAEAITKEYANEYFCYVVDMFDDCAVGRFYSYLDGSCKLLRVKYTCGEDGVITLGDVNEVHVVYEDMPAPVSTTATLDDNGVEPAASVANAEKQSEEEKDANPKDPEGKPADEPEDDNDPEKKDKTQASCGDPEREDEEEKDKNFTSTATDAATSSNDTPADDAAQITNAQITETEKVGAVNEQTEEESSGSAALTESERAEFEALKREKKESLINSYKDNLTEEEYNGFFANIDSFSSTELENELLKIYKKKQEEQPAKRGRAFSLTSAMSPKNEKKESLLVSLIKENL